MKTVIMVVGVSGSGKSWLCRQLSDKFDYVPHDRCWSHPSAKPDDGLDPKWGPPGSKSTHVECLREAAKTAEKAIITEVPFAERKLREDLEKSGLKVIPVFVIEDPDTVSTRYKTREGKPIHKSALSRASTLINRAKEWRGFYGTSKEVLDHLKDLKLDRMSQSEWRAFNRDK